MDKDKQAGKLYEWKKEIILAQLLSIETCVDKLEKLSKEGKKTLEDILEHLYNIECVAEAKGDMMGLFTEIDSQLSVKSTLAVQKLLDLLQESLDKMKKYWVMAEENTTNLQKVLSDCFEEKIISQQPDSIEQLLKIFPNYLLIEVILNGLVRGLPELKKDMSTKKRVIEEVQRILRIELEKTNGNNIALTAEESTVKQVKYCLYVWGFRPEVDESNLKGLKRALTAFFSDYEKN